MTKTLSFHEARKAFEKVQERRTAGTALPLTGNRHQTTKGATIMPTQAHNMGPEERALLQQRRAAIASQLQRLEIELTDLDRQVDDIEQSEGGDTPSALQDPTAHQ